MVHLLSGHIFPMELNIDTHETLPLILKHDFVPPETIMDNPKEKMISDFRKNLREANCHHKMIETHLPWSTAVEMNICELKRGRYQKMIKKQSPKRLWDHCAELESHIHS